MADCKFYDAKCHAADWVAGLSDDFFGKFEAWVLESGIGAVKFAVLAWVRTPTPTVDTESGAVAYLLAYTYPVAFALATLSLLIMAARLAWSQRGEDLVEIGKSLATFVAVTTLGVTVVSALTAAGDSYSRWILESSLGIGPNPSDTQIAERASLVLNVLNVGSGDGSRIVDGIVGLTLVSSFAWLTISSLILIFLTFVRGIMLVLLAGGLPIAAAAGINRTGQQMLGRYGAWIVAWVAFKPATSTVMATGFWMVGTGTVLDTLAGIALIGMTVFMLPFLLRLVTPAAAAFAGGGGAGGSMLAAGAAAAVPVATWLAGSNGGGGDKSSAMKVRDVSEGPSGSTSTPSPPSPPPAANSSSTAGGGTAGASKAASGAGSAAGGAAVGVAAVGAVVKAGKQAARGTAAAATGEGS